MRWMPSLSSSGVAAKRLCSTNRCNCRKAGLNCTDLCACADDKDPCTNQNDDKCDDNDDDGDDESYSSKDRFKYVS